MQYEGHYRPGDPPCLLINTLSQRLRNTAYQRVKVSTMPIITYNGAKPNKENTFLLDVKKEIWTGLKNTNSPALFQWSDGTEVTLTYWNENEPSVPFNKTPNCVSYLGKVGHLL